MPTPTPTPSTSTSTRPSSNDAGWQVIYTFFDILDQNKKGRIDKSDIIHGLQVIGDKNLVEALHLSPLNAHDSISKNQLYKIFFQKREETANHRLAKQILIWILPTFYAATTSFPFVSIPLEIMGNRNGTLQQVGIIIGLYQAVRAVANGLITTHGGKDPLRKLHLFMITIALIGWTICAFGPQSVWTLLSCSLVGFGEVVVNLQSSLLQQVRKESPVNVADQGVLTKLLRLQYMNVSLGICMGYILGGITYTNFGFKATALLGVFSQIIQIIFTLVFLAVSNDGGTSSKESIHAEDSVAKTPQDFYQQNDERFIRAVLYKLKALSVLIDEASIYSSEWNTTTNTTTSVYDEQTLKKASKMAKKNPILMGSMRYLYYSFTQQARNTRIAAAATKKSIVGNTTTATNTTTTPNNTNATTNGVDSASIPTSNSFSPTSIPQITSMFSYDIYTPMLQMMETNEEVMHHSSRSISASLAASRTSNSANNSVRDQSSNGNENTSLNRNNSLSTNTLRTLGDNENISHDAAPVVTPYNTTINTTTCISPAPPNIVDNNISLHNSHTTVQTTNTTASSAPKILQVENQIHISPMLPPAQTLSYEPLSPQALNYENLARVAVQLMDGNNNGLINEKEFTSFLAPRVYHSIYGGFESSSVTIVWPYSKWIVVTQSIIALCMGIFLSTSLLMYSQRFGIDSEYVGFLLGVGEGVGAIVLYCAGIMDEKQQSMKDKNQYDVTEFNNDDEEKTENHDPSDTNISNQSKLLHPYHQHTDENDDADYPTKKIHVNSSIWRTLITRPLHIPVILCVLGVSTILFSTPIFAVAVTFQICALTVHGLCVSFLNELLASSTPPHIFRKYQSIGQWIRRLSNSVTGIFGPMLFGVHEKLPFLLFGCIVFVWALFMWFVFYCHLSTILEGDHSLDATNHTVGADSDESDVEEHNHGISTHYTPYVSEYNERIVDKLKLCSSSMWTRPFTPLKIFHRTVDTPLYELERNFFNSHREELEEELIEENNDIANTETWDTAMS